VFPKFFKPVETKRGFNTEGLTSEANDKPGAILKRAMMATEGSLKKEEKEIIAFELILVLSGSDLYAK
jgi:hypothetical protein